MKASRWIRRGAVVGLGVLSLGVATGTAYGQGAVEAVPQTSAQEASTGQAVATSADASDSQPTNILISVRIDSPGDNGPVTQTSTTAVAGTAANDAATTQDSSQDWAPAGPVAAAEPQASAQDGDTDQAAGATATATRARPVNAVVSVRVNSPGDDAPVTQTSTVIVGAQSKNAAATAQHAKQAQVGGGGGGAVAGGATAPAPLPSPPAAPEPAHGAVAEPPATAPQQTDAPTTPTCVRVDPAGKAVARVVITIGASCESAPSVARPVPRHRPAAVAPARPRTQQPAPSVPVSAPAPAAPVVHPAAAATPRPHPSRPAPRPRAAEPKSLDPPAAATKVAHLVAAAASVQDATGGRGYELLLALLLATLGAAAVWSYAAAHPRCFWRAR